MMLLGAILLLIAAVCLLALAVMYGDLGLDSGAIACAVIAFGVCIGGMCRDD